MFPMFPKQGSISFYSTSSPRPSTHHHEDKMTLNNSSVSIFMFFTGPIEHHAFDVFARKETPFFSVISIFVIFTLWFAYNLSLMKTQNNLMVIWLILSIFVSTLSLCSLLTLCIQKKYLSFHQFLERLHCTEKCLENFSALLLSAAWGVLFISREVQARYTSTWNNASTPENAGSHHHFIAVDALYVLMISPLMIKMILGQLVWRTELLTCAFLAAFACGTIASFDANTSMAFVLTAIIMDFFVLYLKRYQLIYNFYEKRRSLERTGLMSAGSRDLSEQEYSRMHSQAIEWRFLLGNIAHDLKTPLTAISNGCDMLHQTIHSLERHSPRSSADSRTQALNQELQAANETVMNLTHTCAFMNMIINRCIDYTKASHGLNITPHLESVELNHLVQETISCVKDLQPTQDISLTISSVLPSLNIITDKQWLHENLLCLLSNAVKFGPNGNISIEIDLLKGNSSSPMLRIAVEDHGIGVPEDYRDDLFAPNHQTKFSTGGTGLGLYCLSLRCQALQGECGIEDRKDKKQGSRFWFTVRYVVDDKISSFSPSSSKSSRIPSLALNSNVKVAPQPEHSPPPTVESAVEDPPNIEKDQQEAGQTTESSRMSAMINRPQLSIQIARKYKILVVDDSLPILRMTTKMLEKDGHTTMQAMNGRDALTCLEQENFDIVLMDLQMPIMDGFEAVRTLRAQEQSLLEAQLEKQLSENTTTGDDVAKEDALREGTTPVIGYKKITPSSTRTRILGGDTNKIHPFSLSNSTHRQLVIGCSANSDEMTMEDAFRAGVDDFMAKPFTLKKFNELVERILR